MEIVKEFWALLMAGFGVIIWGLRLESRATVNSSQIAALWKQMEKDLAALTRQRAEDLEAAKESRMATNKTLEEIRSDIKALLRRHE